MGQLIKSNYIKDGAVFASGEEAKDNKNSLFPPEVAQEVADTETQLLESGVLLQPYVYGWDQDTFVLTVEKHVTSALEYNNNRLFSSSQVVALAEEAGWTHIGNTITDF